MMYGDMSRRCGNTGDSTDIGQEMRIGARISRAHEKRIESVPTSHHSPIHHIEADKIQGFMNLHSNGKYLMKRENVKYIFCVFPISSFPHHHLSKEKVSTSTGAFRPWGVFWRSRVENSIFRLKAP
jgi:hypothetical protein